MNMTRVRRCSTLSALDRGGQVSAPGKPIYVKMMMRMRIGCQMTSGTNGKTIVCGNLVISDKTFTSSLFERGHWDEGLWDGRGRAVRSRKNGSVSTGCLEFILRYS